MLILGLSCISCAAHQIHISLPANPLLDSGVIIPLSEECAVNADLILDLELDLKSILHSIYHYLMICSIRQQQVYS